MTSIIISKILVSTLSLVNGPRIIHDGNASRSSFGSRHFRLFWVSESRFANWWMDFSNRKFHKSIQKRRRGREAQFLSHCLYDALISRISFIAYHPHRRMEFAALSRMEMSVMCVFTWKVPLISVHIATQHIDWKNAIRKMCFFPQWIPELQRMEERRRAICRWCQHENFKRILPESCLHWKVRLK